VTLVGEAWGWRRRTDSSSRSSTVSATWTKKTYPLIKHRDIVEPNIAAGFVAVLFAPVYG
jgi:hypothetical protein